MNSRQWADRIIADIKRVTDAVKAASPSSGGSPIAAHATVQASLNPDAVASALAEAVKSDNSTTQAIAIRLGQLYTKYPQRAA